MRKKIIISLMAALVSSQPALSANNPKEHDSDKKLISDYVACIVKKHHEKAREAILATADNATIMQAFWQLHDSDCVVSGRYGVSMRFPHQTLQYLLADALVSAEFMNNGDTDFSNRLPLAQPTLISAEDKMKQLSKVKDDDQRELVKAGIATRNAFGWLARYGECVARKDPVNTRYWLLTPSDTPEESSRINALGLAFGLCLGDGTVHFNRATIRGTVALNYYRLVHATIVPGEGSLH